MDSYLRAKGSEVVGPLIQYTKPEVKEDGTLEVKTIFMLQSKNMLKLRT